MPPIYDRGVKGKKPRPQAYNTLVRRGLVAGPLAPKPLVNRSPDRQDARRPPAQQRHDTEFIAQTVRDMRVKALREKGRGAGTRAIKRELEGRGQIAKLATSLGRDLARARPSQMFGGKTSFEGKGKKTFQASPVTADYLTNLLKDAANLPANIVPSAYLPAAGVVEAIHGHPQRLKGLIHEAAATDPVYNTAAAAANLAKLNPKAAGSHLSKVRKTAYEHPGFTAAEFFGGRGALGRIGGGLVRTGARATGNATLSRLGSTARAPRTLPGTNLVEHRRYSKDIIAAHFQRGSDKHRARQADEWRARAARATDPERKAQLELRAREADPLIMRDKHIARRVHEHRAMVEGVRRLNQGKLLKAERDELKGAKHGGPITSLLAQRITRPTLKSLERYRNDVAAVQKTLEAGGEKAKLKANQQLVHDLDQAIGKIKSGEVSLDELKGIADRYIVRNRTLQKKLTSRKRGIYNTEQSERRAVTPFAMREMGVHRDPKFLAEQEKAAREESARLGKQAAKSRGKALHRHGEHVAETKAAIETLNQVPARTRAAIEALKAQERTALSERNVREVGVNQAAKRAEKKTKKAQTAAAAHDEALAIKRANPLLIEHKVDPESLHSTYQISDSRSGARLENVHVGGFDAPTIGRNAAGERIHGEPTKYNVRAEIHVGGQKVGDISRIYDRETGALIKTRTSIDESHQRKGIGSRLARAEEAALARAGINKVHVIPGTEAGRALTGRLGGFKALEHGRMEKQLKGVAPGKRVVTTKEMLEALQKAHGEDTQAALVSQKPPQRSGGGDYYDAAGKPVSGEQHTFGGKATLEGTGDFSLDRLERQQARTQALADSFDAYKEFISEFARRHESGKDKGKLLRRDNYDDARQLADDFGAKGDVQWSVVRLAPHGDQLQAMLEGTAPEHGLVHTLQDALSAKEGDKGTFAVVPTEAAKTMRAHMDALAPTTLERGLRSVASGFQRTVLATSLPWMVGNVSEATLRSALNNVTPAAYLAGRRYLKAIEQVDKDAHASTRALTLGGGQAAYLDRQIHANLNNYADGLVRDLTKMNQRLRGQPIARHLSKGWDVYTHFVFNTVNKSVENFFQTGMLGKAVRNELMTVELKRASAQAVKEFAQDPQRGMSRNTAVHLGREIDKMYGRYDKFSPDARALIARYTPFGAWARNAVEFLFTMPQRHPLTTAVGAAAANATVKERERLGLEIGSGLPNELPLWLQGSIPDSHGGHYRVSRFSPMSLAGDPLGTIQGQVLPQFHGVLYAMNGLDWTGKPLRDSKGQIATTTGARAQAALWSFIDATVPGVSLTKRVIKKGPISILQSAAAYAPRGKPQKKAARSGGAPQGSSFGGSSFSGSSFSGGSSFK